MQSVSTTGPATLNMSFWPIQSGRISPMEKMRYTMKGTMAMRFSAVIPSFAGTIAMFPRIVSKAVACCIAKSVFPNGPRNCIAYVSTWDCSGAGNRSNCRYWNSISSNWCRHRRRWLSRETSTIGAKLRAVFWLSGLIVGSLRTHRGESGAKFSIRVAVVPARPHLCARLSRGRSTGASGPALVENFRSRRAFSTG